jgi:hypothetical protein
LKTITKFVVFCIAFLVLYTVVSIVIFYKTGNEASTLTNMVFTVFGIELVSCMVKAIINKKR